MTYNRTDISWPSIYILDVSRLTYFSFSVRSASASWCCTPTNNHRYHTSW